MGSGVDMRGIAWYGVIRGCLKLLPFVFLVLAVAWAIIAPGLGSLWVRGETGVTDDGVVVTVSHIEAWPRWPFYIYVGHVAYVPTAAGGPQQLSMRLPVKVYVNELTLE
jgi:hypothetical protein